MKLLKNEQIQPDCNLKQILKNNAHNARIKNKSFHTLNLLQIF